MASSLRIFFVTPGLLCFFLLLGACRYTAPDYQQQYAVPDGGWRYEQPMRFQFQVDDTTAGYQLYLILRHTNAYPFSNIWLRLGTKKPDDTAMQFARFEVTLAAAPGINADGTTAGGWLGRGMGEVWEQRRPLYPLSHPLYFNRTGMYIVELSQDMRLNPLPDVLQAGLRLEKIGPVADSIRNGPAGS